MTLSGYKFCNPVDDKSLSANTQGIGYCCPSSLNLSKGCLINSGCTFISPGSVTDPALLAVYLTYYPGLTSNHVKMCGGD